MSLHHQTVVVLVYPRYQELDFWYSVLRSREEGATVRILGSDPAGSESILGYPAVPDTTASAIDPATVGVVIAPGVAPGTSPAFSSEQAALVRAVRDAGGVIAAVGNGREVLAGAVPDRIDGERVIIATGTDDLAPFYASVRAALTLSPAVASAAVASPAVASPAVPSPASRAD
jgi:protease I